MGKHQRKGPAKESAGTPASRAEVCAVACAELFRGAGEILVSAFGTAPALGARLAKLTFAPDLVLTDGEAAMVVGAPALGARPGELVREAPLAFREVFSVVWSGRRHVMMMASQVDREGNQNISAVGDHGRPKAQLVGTRGAPGNSVNHPTSYWVPSHSPRTFVSQVDVVCGVGWARAAAAGLGASRHHQVVGVVSNLGVFDFEGPGRTMQIRSLHPGVSLEQVQAATGFPLRVPTEIPVSRLPDEGELELLREVLDPEGWRDREVPG